MGGGYEQFLGGSTIAYASAYVEGHEAAGDVRLLCRVEYRRFGHDVSSALKSLRAFTDDLLASCGCQRRKLGRVYRQAVESILTTWTESSEHSRSSTTSSLCRHALT